MIYKVKVALWHVCTGTQGVGGGVAPTIRKLCSRSSGLATPRPGRFTPRRTRYSLEASEPNWTGTGNLAPHRVSISGTCTPKRVAVPTVLFRARVLMCYAFQLLEKSGCLKYLNFYCQYFNLNCLAVWHQTGSKLYKYRVIIFSEKYHLSLATANPPNMWTVGCATLTLKNIPHEVVKDTCHVKY